MKFKKIFPVELYLPCLEDLALYIMLVFSLIFFTYGGLLIKETTLSQFETYIMFIIIVSLLFLSWYLVYKMKNMIVFSCSILYWVGIKYSVGFLITGATLVVSALFTTKILLGLYESIFKNKKEKAEGLKKWVGY